MLLQICIPRLLLKPQIILSSKEYFYHFPLNQWKTYLPVTISFKILKIQKVDSLQKPSGKLKYFPSLTLSPILNHLGRYTGSQVQKITVLSYSLSKSEDLLKWMLVSKIDLEVYETTSNSSWKNGNRNTNFISQHTLQSQGTFLSDGISHLVNPKITKSLTILMPFWILSEKKI